MPTANPDELDPTKLMVAHVTESQIADVKQHWAHRVLNSMAPWSCFCFLACLLIATLATMRFSYETAGGHYPLRSLASTKQTQMHAARIHAAVSAPPSPASRARLLAPRPETHHIVNSTHQRGILGAFAALGGSNTVGANRQGMSHSFAELLFDELRAKQLVDRFDMGGIGAMGPFFAAACTQKYVQEDTRFATIEFMPNMGWSNNDEGDLSAIEILLQALRSRSAKTVLVTILPGSDFPFFKQCLSPAIQGCQTHEHMLQLYHRLLSLADTFSVPIVAMDYNDPLHQPYFSDDLLHLNQNGHQVVQRRVLRAFETWTSWRHAPAKRVAGRMRVACHLGSEITPLVGKNDGFSMINFATFRQEQKIGWEARAPAAELVLCSDLPSPAADGEEKRLAGSQHIARFPYSIVIGLQQSPEYKLPLFGVARITCHGACVCMCTSHVHGACLFDGLVPFGPAVTDFVRLHARDATPLHRRSNSSGCGPTQCAVRIVVNNTAGRSRVLLRSFTIGFFAAHDARWLNFYFGTNESRQAESDERRTRVRRRKRG